MPVKAYVAGDTGSQEWPPAHSHEVAGAIGLVQRPWAAALRFEIVENEEHRYRPYRLEPHHIAALVKELHAVDWSTAHALMPSERAYAYLIVTSAQGQDVFPLRTLDVRIGRSASNCALTVPHGHGKVSRIHAGINRYGDQIWLRDLQSQHGTFVNGRPVAQATMLRPGDRVAFGGPTSGPGVFTCEFVRQLPDHVQATETFEESP